MTDKEIIIDGVDVSQCRYLFDDTSYKRSKTSCSITLKDCKYLGDKCYFKQLKRQQYYLEKIRAYELNSLDVEWDEYEQHCCDTEYSPIIDYVELALGEKEDE